MQWRPLGLWGLVVLPEGHTRSGWGSHDKHRTGGVSGSFSTAGHSSQTADMSKLCHQGMATLLDSLFIFVLYCFNVVRLLPGHPRDGVGGWGLGIGDGVGGGGLIQSIELEPNPLSKDILSYMGRGLVGGGLFLTQSIELETRHTFEECPFIMGAYLGKGTYWQLFMS